MRPPESLPYHWGVSPVQREGVTCTLPYYVFVELRDSGSRHFIPAHYAMGVWSDGKIVNASSSAAAASSGNSSRHSGQGTIIKGFPKGLGSWWETKKNGDRGSTQNFAACFVSIVVWPGEPCLRKCPNFKKCILLDSGHVQNLHKFQFCFSPGQKPRRELQDR